jgi:predicted TIM-barrel fold metal-dependent hydrolase
VEKEDRRDFLQGSLLAAAGAGICTQTPPSGADANQPKASSAIVDTNVYISRWPFRRIPADDTAQLVELLRRHGVVQAWTGSFDGVFHKDVAAANARLAEECRTRGQGLLVPFGAVNPKLPDWEEDLRRCCEQHRMPGIRLHPNYHGYTLEDPAFARLLQLASERGLIVQLAAWMEDERHQNQLMPVPEVSLAPLEKLVSGLPELRIVLLNAIRISQNVPLLSLMKRGQLYFDLAALELIEGLGVALQSAPIDRILFGSYSPTFYFEATLLKLRESVLSEAQAKAILEGNARRLLAMSKWEADKP